MPALTWVGILLVAGDASMKLFLCSDADVSSFTLTGTEDYVVLGCDGIWDVLAPVDIPFLVHAYLQQHPNDHGSVAKHLVTKAKEMGSGDNISCIVVFLRRDIAEPVGMQLEGLHFVRENGEHQEECASDISGSHLGSSASTTSGSTGVSRFTLSSTTGVPDSVDGLRRSSFLGPDQDAQGGDFPFRLERQTGFFLPSLRSLRTGHHKQQLVPLAEGRRGVVPSASQEALQPDPKKKEEHSLKLKALSKGSTKRGPTKRRLKTRGSQRRRGRHSGANSPDSSSWRDSNLGDDISLSSFVPSHSSETLAKHTSLAEILQQMSDPADENTNPNPEVGSRPNALSVRGMSAQIHNSLPRIPSLTPSSLLNSTTAMTPVTTSRHSNLHPEHLLNFPHAKGRYRAYNR